MFYFISKFKKKIVDIDAWYLLIRIVNKFI